MKKRFLATLLTLCMVFSLIPAAHAASDSVFTDVGAEDWFYDEVRYVYEKGLMQGTGATVFSPHLTTTRGMIVAILHRLDGEPAAAGSCPFDDVAAGKYYETAITWAAANNIVGGYGGGRFGPDDKISREQLAAILYRYAGYQGYDVSAAADLSAFTDADRISGYALPAMRWANACGLVNGKGGGLLDPAGSAERCQVAAILSRFCRNILDKDGRLTVAFLLNDGSSAAYKTVRVAAGKTVAQPAAPSRGGYSFSGWYTAASGGARFDFQTAVTASVTLYARWTAAGGGGGSTSEKTAATAADFIAAAQVSASTVKATILPANSITVNDDIAITNNSVGTLTLELGSASVGDLTVNSTSARTINVNGTTASVSSLTINAPNATVNNHAAINGSMNILAASHNTVNNYGAISGTIRLSGPCALNDTQEVPVPVIVATDKAVTVKGNSASINVVADGAQLTVAPAEGKTPTVESSAADVSLNVDTNNTVTIAGTVDNVQATSTAPNLTVDGTVGSIDAKSADKLIVAGTGSVSALETGKAVVQVKHGSQVSVEKLTAAGGSISAPANTVSTVAASGTVKLNTTVNTVEAAANTTLTLGNTAAVNVVEAGGSLTLDGDGKVNSIDVQANTASIDMAAYASVDVAQVTAPAAAHNITVSGLAATVQTKAAKPANIGVTAPSTAGGQGTITGVTDQMAYKLITAAEWTSVSGNTLSVDAGTYLVHIKAAGTSLASEAVTVTVPAAVGVTSAAIQGTPYVGQTLTAVANADATGTLRYAWKVRGSDAVIGRERTFTLTDAQINKEITVTISNYDATGITSSPTGIVKVDMTALTKLIAKAEEVRQGVDVRPDNTLASAVAAGVIFVTNTESLALHQVKRNAEVILASQTTPSAVSAQETSLRAAIDAYVKAKKAGTLSETAELRVELGHLIDKANGVHSGVPINASAEAVTPNAEWVFAADDTAFGNAISTANIAKGKSAPTESELTAAIKTLNEAITAYLKAIRKGAALDSGALLAALNAGGINRASVKTGTQSDVLPSQTWVPAAAWTAYGNALNNAMAVVTRPDSGKVQNDYITALNDLNAATEIFNAAKRPGTKDIVPPVVSGVSAAALNGAAAVTLTSSEDGSYTYTVGASTSESFPLTAETEASFQVNNYTDNTPISIRVADGSGNVTEITVAANKHVAAIGGVNYESLQEAIAAADGQTVKLLKPVALTTQIGLNETLTLDLNGWSITGKDCRVFLVNGGVLTLAGKGTVSSTRTEDSTFSASSSVIRVSGDAGEAKLIVGEHVTVSTAWCYGISIFGTTNPQALDVRGTVAVTGEKPAIGGNGQPAYTATQIRILDGAVVTAANSAAVFHPQAGTLTITGGKITGVTAVEAESGTITVSGGAELTATDTPVFCSTENVDSAATKGYALAVVERAGYKGSVNATVHGGKFTGAVGKAVSSANAANPNTLAVHGGTFSDLSGLSYCADNAIYTLGGNVDLGDGYRVIQNKAVTFDLNGFTVTSSSAYFTLAAYAGGALTIRDTSAGKAGEVVNTATGSNAVGVSGNGAVTLHSGKLSGAHGIYVYSTAANSKVNLNGGTVAGTIACVAAMNGTVTLDGASLTSSTKWCYGVTGQGNGAPADIKILSGSIDVPGVAIYQPAGGKVTVSGGDVTGNVGVFLCGGSLEMTGGTVSGENMATGDSYDGYEYFMTSYTTTGGSGTMSTGSGIVVLDRRGSGYYTEANGTTQIAVRISGGVVKSDGVEPALLYVDWNNVAAETKPAALSISGGTFTGGGHGAVQAYTRGDPVTQRTGFLTGGSFTDLVNAVAYAADGAVVTLADNVENGGGVVVPEGKKITLDFAGNTYTVTRPVGSAGTENQCFQLLKDAVVTLKGGAIAANDAGVKVMIQNYADLTLEDMVLDATTGTNSVAAGYVLSINNGTVKVQGNTSLTAPEGESAMEMSWWPSAYPAGAQVTLNTAGTITGNIEVGLYGKDGTLAAPVLSQLNIEAVHHIGGIVTYNAASGTYNTGLGETAAAALFAQMLTVTGGSFSGDPSAYVPATHAAAPAGGTWTVAEKAAA